MVTATQLRYSDNAQSLGGRPDHWHGVTEHFDEVKQSQSRNCGMKAVLRMHVFHMFLPNL
jgi:hypothetical protein